MSRIQFLKDVHEFSYYVGWTWTCIKITGSWLISDHAMTHHGILTEFIFNIHGINWIGQNMLSFEQWNIHCCDGRNRSINNVASSCSFPAYIAEHLHRANVELPLSAAGIFRQDRQTISAAVHAFYYRDPLDVRACRQPEFFPPEDLVSWQVNFPLPPLHWGLNWRRSIDPHSSLLRNAKRLWCAAEIVGVHRPSLI